MYTALGKKIRKARQARMLTQETLAEKSGISASFLGHIERGSRKASLETVINLANALGVGANELLAESLVFMRGGVKIDGDERKARLVAAIFETLDEHWV
jgi:transcriptional regulator with XRE-family HTH domain